MQTEHHVTFDRYRLDLAGEQLWCGSEEIPLPGKAFALLRYLVEHAGQLVSKAEVFAALWPGIAVTDGALTFCIVELRKALGDNAKAPRFIETVHRRGYRFIAEVISSQHAVVSSKEEARGWRLETSPVSSQASSLQSQVSSFVGRETELAQLHSWLAKALSGERQIVFVTGEVGIGKTSLLEAFVAEVRDQEKNQKAKGKNQKSKIEDSFPAPSPQPLAPGMWVAVGQCIEQYGPGEPYMPILEALGRLCREPGGERLIALFNQYAPTWLVQMPTLLNATELEALQRKVQGTTQKRMLREMTEAIDIITAERPFIFWLEDLHWSDVSTLELLALLARRREPARLLVIGTYRPVELLNTAHPLTSVTQELFAHGLSTELVLGVLNEGDVATYLTQRFPFNIFPTRLVQVLHQRTEGNPLFLVSVIQDLITREKLIEEDGHWLLHEELEVMERSVPENIRRLVARQRERLQPDEQHLLEAASVAGLEFSAATIAAVVERPFTEVETQWSQLAERQQFVQSAGLSEWPDGTVAARYRFQHALYRQLWHERVPLTLRQRFHFRIGERLEAAYGRRGGEIAAELALTTTRL